MGKIRAGIYIYIYSYSRSCIKSTVILIWLVFLVAFTRLLVTHTHSMMLYIYGIREVWSSENKEVAMTRERWTLRNRRCCAHACLGLCMRFHQQRFRFFFCTWLWRWRRGAAMLVIRPYVRKMVLVEQGRRRHTRNMNKVKLHLGFTMCGRPYL